VGFQYDTDVANGRNWSYYGNRILAGVQTTLPSWNTQLSYNMDVHFVNYLHANTLFPITHPGSVQRSDIEQVHIFALVQPLPFLRRLEGGSAQWPLSFRFEYQIGVTTSDIALYAYQRNVASVSIAYTY
jgi:hypothetical protein